MYQIKLKTTIFSLEIDLLLSYVQMGKNLDMELSHSIILVKRKNVDDLLRFTIEPISLSVKWQPKQRGVHVALL